MKIINFELSKRLNDLGLLDNIETEYFYYKPIMTENIYKIGPNTFVKNFEKGDIKTLTLEEAIEFLRNSFWFELKFIRGKINLVVIGNNKIGMLPFEFEVKTLLEAIEKMIEYLLDNNLITNKGLGTNI